MTVETVPEQFERSIDRCRYLIERQLRVFMHQSRPGPRTVAEPVHYVFAKRGKWIRPVLLLLTCDAVGGRLRDALPAAVAFELLHNFTLVHDDIMDYATYRRGRATVHTRWDQNTAILVGDELVALAYRSLLQTKSPRLEVILKRFTEAFVAVCEGQGFDKEFETQRGVSLAGYLTMIELKTARIISAAAEIGALIGGGTSKQVVALRKYGLHLGLAFQVQDDLLDVIADESRFGKPIGADIVSGKKTYLLARALQKAKGPDRALLLRVVRRHASTGPSVPRIRAIYEKCDVFAEARRTVKEETMKAKRALGNLLSRRGRTGLNSLADLLLMRNF